MMTIPALRSFAVLVAATVVVLVPAHAQEGTELMWEMRDKYTFDGETVDVGYAIDYGEWRIVAPNLGEIFRPIGSQVVLADGTIVRPQDCGMGLTTRDPAANAIGTGTVFLTMCPVKDNLKITHKVASYQDRSGLTVHLEVQNTGATPVSIKALKPMVVKPGDISQVRMVADGDEGPYVFTNQGERVAVLIGVLPLGGAKTELRFDAAMTGGATATFEPPLTLAPGDRVETDPIMILSVYSDPEQARDYFKFTQTHLGLGPAAPAAEGVAAPAPAQPEEPVAERRRRGRVTR